MTLLRHFLLALALLAVLASPAAAQTDPTFVPIAGNWEHHGFFVTVNPDGTSTADWRVYIWCGRGVPQPCDQLLSDRIVDGGHAEITFTGPDDSGAFQGEVTATSDPELLDLGPVTLVPQDYDMALMEQGATQITLCGDRSADLAPQDVLEQCGA